MNGLQTNPYAISRKFFNFLEWEGFQSRHPMTLAKYLSSIIDKFICKLNQSSSAAKAQNSIYLSQPHFQGKGNWELFQEIIRAFYFFHEFLYSPFRICPFATFFLFAFFSLCRTPFFRVLMKHKCFLSPFADVFRICMRIGQALAAPCQYSCKSLLQLEGGGEKKKKCATTTVKSGDIVLLLQLCECLLLLLLLYQTILLAMLSHLFNCLPGPIPRDDLISVAKRLEGEIKSKNSEYSCSPHSVNSDCSSFYC